MMYYFKNGGGFKWLLKNRRMYFFKINDFFCRCIGKSKMYLFLFNVYYEFVYDFQFIKMLKILFSKV